MLYNEMNYVKVCTERDVCTAQEFKNCNFQYIFLNWIISVIHGAKFIQFGTLVVKGYLEGTLSQNIYLGPSFYSMKSRKLGCKKW